MKILAAQKSTVLMLENGSNTLTTPAALDTMLIDLTLHQIRSQDLMAQLQLLEKSDLRSTLKHHAVGLLNTDLSTNVKVENTIRLFTKADDLHGRASITSLEKIYSALPLDMNSGARYILENRKLVESRAELQLMFDKGKEQFDLKISYNELEGVNELTQSLGDYFIRHLGQSVDMLCVLLKHLTAAEFVGCITFQCHMVPMIGGVLFFKFALPLLVEGNFISMLSTTKLYILAKLESMRKLTGDPNPTIDELGVAKRIAEDLMKEKTSLLPKIVENDASPHFKASKGVENTLKNSPLIQKLLIGGVGGLGVFIISSLLPNGLLSIDEMFKRMFRAQAETWGFVLGKNIRELTSEFYKGLSHSRK